MKSNSLVVFAVLPLAAMAKTEANWSSNTGGSVGLPIFLGAATLLQVAFLCVGFKKLYGKKSPGSEAKAVALIALAFADFVWALCCFVSCIMTKKQSTFWGGEAGCDGQGYYSTLACFSTMFLTMQITHITHTQVSEGAAALPTRGRMVLSSVSIYAFAMLLSAIPFLPSTGGFVYTAEGFCFIDYYDQAINTVFLLSMLVSMSHVCVFVFAIFFTLYYVCGYPLVIQGYQGVSFANKLQITSGLLAHGAELINPFLYGIFWCKWFMNDGIDGTPAAAGKSVTSSITWGGSDSDAKANVAPNNSIGYSYSVSVV
eukprot:gene11346-16436_t